MVFKLTTRFLPISLAVLCCHCLNGCSLLNRGNIAKQKADIQELTVHDVSIKDELDFLPTSVTNLEEGHKIVFNQTHQFHKMTLKNGFEIYILQRHDLPQVSLAIIIESGKYQMKDKDERLSPLVLKFLKHGTKKYPKQELQKRMTWLGRPIRYRQTARYSVISAQILPQDLGFTLDLLSQQLFNLRPDKQALRKVIERQLLENKLTQSSGLYLAKLLFYQKNYPMNHFYNQLQPNSDKIKKVTRDDLMAFYKRKYRANQSAIIIAGDIDLNSVNKQIEDYFSDWDRVPAKKESDYQSTNHHNRLPLPQISVQKLSVHKNEKPTLSFIERKGAKQIDLLYGVVTAPRTSVDWISLKMIASLLGGGPSSRLFNDLREKQGLAYYISAQQTAGLYSSPFLIQTSVAHDKLVPVMRGISHHLNFLCKNEITKGELDRIKQQLSGEMLFKLQTNQQMVKNKIRRLEHSMGDDYLDEVKNQISNISSMKLMTVAHKYLCGPAQFIGVGDTGLLEQDFYKKIPEYLYKEYRLPLH